MLVHGGMLETRQGDGTYVRATRDAGETLRRIARTQLAEQLEVRIMLETEAAKLAAHRRTEQDLRHMTTALDARAISQTIEQTETDADLPEPSQEDHELLLAAVRRQDEGKAESLARALLKPSLQALKRRES